MDTSKRNALIEEYYDAVDAAEINRFEDVFAPEAIHFRPGQGTLEGLSAIIGFFESEWRSTETSHTLEKRIHEEELTVTRMHVSGVYEGDPFEGRFLAEFEFSSNDQAIISYRLYRGYQR